MQFNEYNSPPIMIHQYKPPKKYGFLKFMVDCFMTAITSGFWLIWVFVREMRKRR